MNAISVAMPAHVLEATRLTREGRLSEAMALLQGQSRREVAGAPPDTSCGAPSAPAGREVPRTFDVEPETGTVTGESSSSPAGRGWGIRAGMRSATAVQGMAVTPTPQALCGLFDGLKPSGLDLGLHGFAGRSLEQAAPPIPEGARFLLASFSSNAGSRDYKLYVPSSYQGEPVPLVVMLHGCTQSPDDFAAGTGMNALAEQHAFLVAYPAQPASANAQKCWNWFSPGDQERGCGEPALIAGITHQVMRDWAVDPARVYVAGLSAGGAAAAIMGEAYPDLYAAVGVHSGLACGAARDMPSAFAAMRGGGAGTTRRNTGAEAGAPGGRVLPTIVFHADRDRTVHPVNGDQVVAQAGAAAGGSLLRTTTEPGQVPGGHAYSRTLHSNPDGGTVLEQWVVHGGGHAWSGGSPAGSYTDPRGPDASREMLRFFLDHPHPLPRT
jgi:poly(hydroxyalkanoate) depolymerase family esterase